MNNCIICNWKQKKFLNWTDFWLKTTSKNFEIIKCEDCWLEQIFPTPDNKEITSFYKKNYYSYQYERVNKIKIFLIKIISVVYKFLFTDKNLNLSSYKDWKWKSFLEVWCWSWYFVNMMKSYWYNSEWFELWDKWKKWDIFYWDSIVNINFWRKYDLIYCSHVFEHISNPIEFLNKLKEILKDDWKCIFYLPNIDSLSSKIFKQYALERDIPRHLYNYNFDNFDKLVSKMWFKIIIKYKMKQMLFFESFVQVLEFKYNIIIPIFLKKIFKIPFYLFDVVLSVSKTTNQMWFLLTK